METLLHLQMGMYGAVNVLPPGGSNHVYDGGPAFDFERTWITAEIDIAWLQEDADFTRYEPDYFLINGKDGSDITADPYTTFDIVGDETVLLRVGNMGYLPVRYTFDELSTEVLQSDGRTLPTVSSGEGLLVTPGERFDILLRGKTSGLHAVHLDYLDLYDGHVLGTAEVPVNVSGAVDVSTPVPGFALEVSQPRPSPFSEVVHFDLDGVSADDFRVRIMDVRGRVIRAIDLGEEGDSPRGLSWDGRADAGYVVANGVYYIRFMSDGRGVTRKVTLDR